MTPPFTLGFLEPGHFHAALTLKSANPRVAQRVHLYATAGADRDAFVALIDDFNGRTDAPTSWQLEVHETADPLARLIDDGLVDVVVLAGRNAPKLERMARLHAAGIAVLADKPWLTEPAAVAHLDAITAGPPAVVDIMTSRFDELARLRRRVSATPAVFGEFVREAGDGPAIGIGSVHHLLKRVNGVPLRRPPWYFDVAEQGDGLVDIQSHMVDQAQWLVGEGATPFALEADVSELRARRWGTPVSRELFRECTGLDDFPATLARLLADDVLDLQCNSEVSYRLRGIEVRQRAEWAPRAADGGGDIHAAVLRGTRARVRLHHGPETGFEVQIHVEPRPGGDIEKPLREAVEAWREEFPGLALQATPSGFELLVPPALRTTHESHFARVLNEFLDALETRAWSAEMAARLRMRYGLLAAAKESVDA